MLELNAALKRYDILVQKGRSALAWEINERNKNKSEGESFVWFDTGEFVTDLEHFLNEALAPEKTYLVGEDFCTGKKVQIKE